MHAQEFASLEQTSLIPLAEWSATVDDLRRQLDDHLHPLDEQHTR